MDDGYSPLAMAGFELFFRPWMRRRVALKLLRPLPHIPPATPLLVVANHTSWWDPFVVRELQREMRPGAPIRTLMLAKELDRRPFFKRIGVVGINPESIGSIRSVLRQLRGSVRNSPASTVLIFPQGRIWPSHRRPLGFRRGFELLAASLTPIAVLPIALHVEPLNSVKPTIFVLPGKVWDAAGAAPSIAEVEERVTRDLDRILGHAARWGEEAAVRVLDASAPDGARNPTGAELLR
jgi:1-acyl-sn-glycerol-3-phosphate acyltransferase